MLEMPNLRALDPPKTIAIRIIIWIELKGLNLTLPATKHNVYYTTLLTCIDFVHLPYISYFLHWILILQS